MNDKKILIVEDSLSTVKIISKLLRNFDLMVTDIVESGEDAIKSLKSVIPDLILMDITLTGKLDGIETAEKINNSYNIPIIYLTGRKEPEIWTRAEKTSPYGYIIKPIDRNNLHSAIIIALNKHQSEKKYKSLFNNMTDAFLYMHAIVENDQAVNIKVLESNNAFYALTNLTPTEVKGKLITEIFPKISNFKITWKDYIKEIAIEEKNKKQKYYFKNINKWISITAFCPEKFYIALIIEDITEQIKQEKNLREANSNINNIISSIDSILIGVSIDDTISLWNSIAESIFNLKSSEVIGKKFTTISIDWDSLRIYEGISESLTGKKPTFLSDIKLKTNKKNRFLEISINPIFNDKKDISGFLIYGKDITNKKIQEMENLQSQKLQSIGELASGIAHEINTPAQYVNDNLLFCKDATVDVLKIFEENISYIFNNNYSVNYINKLTNRLKEIDYEYLSNEVPLAIEQAIEGITRIATIISSMKRFAHPEDNSKISTNINKALEDTITISKNEWKYSCDIITDFEKEVPEVICFPGELNQVFLNIIVNSAHAINESIKKKKYGKGEIIIKTRAYSDYFEISVSDNGIGIKKKNKEKIFNPFFTTKEIGKGTGQGLAIAYSIITDKHKGRIFVESEEGIGTAFFIQLPYK